MPAKLTAISEGVTERTVNIGEQIRARRKALGVSATTAAEAAGMSRVTWYRIEKGVTSVTLGAWYSALSVLGLDVQIMQSSAMSRDTDNNPDMTASIPVKIAFADFPQLKQLAWQVRGVDTLSPREALTIYERNWRHIDLEAMETGERNLIDALKQVFNGADTHV